MSSDHLNSVHTDLNNHSSASTDSSLTVSTDGFFDKSSALIVNHHDDGFIVSCFFTENYREHAMSLKTSLDEFQLNYCLQPVESRGYWEANTRIKPEFLLHCLHEFSNKNLLYLDADSVVKKPLDYFDTISEDLAIYTTSKEIEGMSHDFLTGTIFIKNNSAGKLLLEKWVDSQDKDKHGKQTQVDQDSIETAIYELKNRISILPLPIAYIKIYDRDYENEHGEAFSGDVYIEQYQASRTQTKLRRQRIRRRNQMIGFIILLVLIIGGWQLFG